MIRSTTIRNTWWMENRTENCYFWKKTNRLFVSTSDSISNWRLSVAFVNSPLCAYGPQTQLHIISFESQTRAKTQKTLYFIICSQYRGRIFVFITFLSCNLFFWSFTSDFFHVFTFISLFFIVVTFPWNLRNHSKFTQLANLIVSNIRIWFCMHSKCINVDRINDISFCKSNEEFMSFQFNFRFYFFNFSCLLFNMLPKWSQREYFKIKCE